MAFGQGHRDQAVERERAHYLSNGMVGSRRLGSSFNDSQVLLGTAIEKPIVASKKA